jgi:hypothetical protein
VKKEKKPLSFATAPFVLFAIKELFSRLAVPEELVVVLMNTYHDLMVCLH